MAETKDTSAGALSAASINSLVDMNVHGEHGRVIGLNVTNEGALALLMACVFGGRTITRAQNLAINTGQKENSVLFADGFVQPLTFGDQGGADAQDGRKPDTDGDPSHVIMPDKGEKVTEPVPEITNPGVADGGAPVDPNESAHAKAKRNDAKTKPQTEGNR